MYFDTPLRKNCDRWHPFCKDHYQLEYTITVILPPNVKRRYSGLAKRQARRRYIPTLLVGGFAPPIPRRGRANFARPLSRLSASAWAASPPYLRRKDERHRASRS